MYASKSPLLPDEEHYYGSVVGDASSPRFTASTTPVSGALADVLTIGYTRVRIVSEGRVLVEQQGTDQLDDAALDSAIQNDVDDIDWLHLATR